MSMLLMTDDLMNALERMTTAATPVPSANSSFPIANLYDRIPSNPFMFGSGTSDATLDFDLSIVTNGSFEASSSTVTGWTNISVAGTALATSTDSSLGTRALIVSASSALGDTGGLTQILPVRASENMCLRITRHAGAAGSVARFRAQNTHTGSYLIDTTSAGLVWSATATDLTTLATTSWAEYGSAGAPKTFTVEAMATGQPELATMSLKIQAYVIATSTGAQTALFDEIAVWPAWDFLAVCGHNLTPAISLSWQAKTGTSASTSDGTVVGTITAFPQAFYSLAASSHTERFVRLKFNGTPASAIYLGEGILTMSKSPERTFDWGPELEIRETEIRSDVRSYRQTDRPVRRYKMNFVYPTSTSFVEARDKIMGASANGHFPIVLVPDTTEADVIYGRVDPAWHTVRDLTAYFRESQLVLQEMALPTMIP